MNVVLPDQILQNQICSLCKLYLSCGPVKSYRDGVIHEVKCGRCSRNKDGGGFSQYNVIAEKVFFPCINRFDGCGHLLRYQETSEHELTCLSSKIRCPLCPAVNVHYVPLALANHFKFNHWKNNLNKPLIKLSSNMNQFYIHCNAAKNIFVLIHVVINDTHLTFKVMSSRTNRVEYRIRIFNGKSREENSAVFSSHLMKCQDFDDDSAGFSVSANLIANVQGLECKFELSLVAQHMLQLPKVKNVDDNNEVDIEYVQDSSELPAKQLPELFMDDMFRSKFGKTHLSSYGLSGDQKSIVDGTSGVSVMITCNFCENYLAVSGRYKKIFFCASCSYSVCGQCHSYGICKVCPRCSLPHLRRSGEMARHYSLNFFCKFRCGQYFKAWDLLEHEDRCALNNHRGLTDTENIWRYFKEKKEENDTFQTSNSILFDPSRFSKDGRIFVVTRDDVRFMIEHKYQQQSNICKCIVRHKYDNVEVLTKICENEKYKKSDCTLYIPFKSEFAFFTVVFEIHFSD
ncbi:uncharacterized protein [Euwallacea fornicatus]|uniref:uncharacterized protein n=1 Tax=Euwallacea fornicatus TaxID=995702 RepID=UPI00338FF653